MISITNYQAFTDPKVSRILEPFMDSEKVFVNMKETHPDIRLALVYHKDELQIEYFKNKGIPVLINGIGSFQTERAYIALKEILPSITPEDTGESIKEKLYNSCK